MLLLFVIWWIGFALAGVLGFCSVAYFISKDLPQDVELPVIMIVGASVLAIAFYGFSGLTPSYWLLCLGMVVLGAAFGWRSARP